MESALLGPRTNMYLPTLALAPRNNNDSDDAAAIPTAIAIVNLALETVRIEINKNSPLRLMSMSIRAGVVRHREIF